MTVPSRNTPVRLSGPKTTIFIGFFPQRRQPTPRRRRHSIAPRPIVGTIALFVAIALWSLAIGARAAADPLPSRVGQCSRTAISRIGQRLEDGTTGRPIPGSGSAVRFANGGSQVSYDEIPQILRSRPGDPVRLCLVSLPRNCPPGDPRGRIYRATNLRTRQSWTLPDSEHSCGGA